MAGSKREVATAEYLAEHLKDMVDPGGRSSFASFDQEENARVKEAIRLYVETWMVPYAKALAASLRGDASGSQLAMLDHVKDRGY